MTYSGETLSLPIKRMPGVYHTMFTVAAIGGEQSEPRSHAQTLYNLTIFLE